MKIIGIDLGSVFSKIAYSKDGKTEIIRNDLNANYTPSLVELTEDGKFVVGENAKKERLFHKITNEFDFKEFMHTGEKIKMGKKSYYPEQLLAIFIKNLKEYAVNKLNDKQIEAVISVPANFNSIQKIAVKRSCEIAGLKIRRIIKDPVAAVMSYGDYKKQDYKRFLVYDFGKSFDVSILEFFRGSLYVSSTRHKRKMGYRTLDKKVVDYILDEVKRIYGIDLKQEDIQLNNIYSAAEKLKEEMLNSDEDTKFNISLSTDKSTKEIELSITNEKINQLFYDVIKQTEYTIDETLDDLNFIDSDIDAVIAIGGLSNLECVKKLLEDRFKEKFKMNINPNFAVAFGAAIKGEGIYPKEEHKLIKEKPSDICKANIGVNVLEYDEFGEKNYGNSNLLIKKGTKLPYTAKKDYYINCNHKNEAIIEVFDGISKMAQENSFIGSLVIKDIPYNARDEKISINLYYGVDNKIKVTGEVFSTGESTSAVFEFKNEEKILKVSDLIKEKCEINSKIEGWKHMETKEQCIGDTIQYAENQMMLMSDDNKIEVGIVLNKLKKALMDNDLKLAAQYEKQLKNML